MVMFHSYVSLPEGKHAVAVAVYLVFFIGGLHLSAWQSRDNLRGQLGQLATALMWHPSSLIQAFAVVVFLLFQDVWPDCKSE
jgi:hypothetical protein